MTDTPADPLADLLGPDAAPAVPPQVLVVDPSMPAPVTPGSCMPVDHARSLLAWVRAGGTVASYARAVPMPLSRLWTWIIGDARFSDALTAARRAGASAMLDQVIDIADGEGRGGKDGVIAVQRDKLRADIRVRIAGMIDPDRFGSRTTIAGDAHAPVTLEVAALTPEQRAARVAALLQAAATKRQQEEGLSELIEGD